MNVWLLKISEALPLTSETKRFRTSLLAEELVRRGHSVTWWCSAFDHHKRAFTDLTEGRLDLGDRFHLRILKGCGYRRNVSRARFKDHRIIAHKFRDQAPHLPPPDLIVASMPTYDMAHEAVAYARPRGIPVIVDIRDPWPENFLELCPKLLRPLARKMLRSEFALMSESLRGATALTSMMEDMLDWGLRWADRPRRKQDRVFYIGNDPISFAEPKSPAVQALGARLKNKFVIAYVGTLGHMSNPEVLLACAQKTRDPRYHFLIVGKGDLLEPLRKRVAGLDNLTLTGWMPPAEAAQLLEHVQIGIVPTQNHTVAFPNKAFFFLAAGVPLLFSVEGEIQTLAQRLGFGHYFPPGDATALLRLIDGIANDPWRLEELRTKTRASFETHFDARRIYSEFAAHLEELSSASSR